MKKPVNVIPAVLTDSPEPLKLMLKQAENFVDYVQIDIMDGKFVPSRSITWQQISEIKTRLKWEAHLMVTEPEKELEHFQKAGAQKVVFHLEATNMPDQVISSARLLGLGIGLAANPETPVSYLLPFVNKVDSILFLSVHPGFYGAKFIPEVLGKIAALRQNYPELNIGIDGGIKENNIAPIAKSGVNQIFVGSAVFLQPSPAESHRKLTLLANQN